MRRSKFNLGLITAGSLVLSLAIPGCSAFKPMSSDPTHSMSGMEDMDMSAPDESRVKFELLGASNRASGASAILFKLMDTKIGKMLSGADLMVSNEKKLHFIAFDPSLTEFQHIHPVYQEGANGTEGEWSVESSFEVNGSYLLFAEGKLASDNVDFLSASPLRITVTGGRPANPSSSDLKETYVATVGTSRVALSQVMLMPGEAQELSITFSRTDGSQPQLSDYLGAKAHLIVTPFDASTLVHAHATQKSSTELTAHAIFPKSGMYRVWIQFIDGGVLKRADLAVSVM